jgi:hypothetical protein
LMWIACRLTEESCSGSSSRSQKESGKHKLSNQRETRRGEGAVGVPLPSSFSPRAQPGGSSSLSPEPSASHLSSPLPPSPLSQPGPQQPDSHLTRPSQATSQPKPEAGSPTWQAEALSFFRLLSLNNQAPRSPGASNQPLAAPQPNPDHPSHTSPLPLSV